MLARLEAEQKVERAEADLHGELLRLQLSDGADLPVVLGVLEQLGFAAEATDEDTHARTWYGPEHVGELSRAEGRIIAQRVIPSFAREHGLDAARTSALTDAVARALHRCFVSHELDASAPPSALRGACERAAQGAAEQLVGRDLARTLGALVAADLASRSTGGADR